MKSDKSINDNNTKKVGKLMLESRSMKQIINKLEKRIISVPQRLTGFAERELAQRPTGKWSKKEILGHLIDSAQTNIRRFVAGQYEDRPKLFYDQDFWVQANTYQLAKTEDLIILWILLNRQVINILHAMPKKNYHRQCDVGKDIVDLQTLIAIAENYITHLDHHLRQLFKE